MFPISLPKLIVATLLNFGLEFVHKGNDISTNVDAHYSSKHVPKTYRSFAMCFYTTTHPTIPKDFFYPYPPFFQAFQYVMKSKLGFRKVYIFDLPEFC